MGWGYYLVARKDHGTDHEQRKELIYWHKFDELFQEIRGFIHYEIPNLFSDEADGTDEVVLNKDQLSKILSELVRLPDYWASFEEELIVPGVNSTGGFSTVVQMCEIVHQYDQIIEEGWEIVFFYG